jgi:hypothetical protein
VIGCAEVFVNSTLTRKYAPTLSLAMDRTCTALPMLLSAMTGDTPIAAKSMIPISGNHLFLT